MKSSYPPVTLPTLEALYRLGKDLCDEIDKFHPDVVIGLAHSGWRPVEVAQVLWNETRSQSFPPSLRTNIGQEKSEIYHERYGKTPPAFCCGECGWGESGRLGHYLAWAAEQKSWAKTLRKQIKAVYPGEPKRILVADDLFGGYLSGYIVLTLLESLYPNAEYYVHAGQCDLTDNFVTGWLAEFIPPLAKEITDLGIDSAMIRYGSEWQKLLKPLINGTEDIDQNSLEWKFITADSDAVKAVAEYVPSEVALSAPQWAADLACEYALQRLRNEIRDDEAVEPPDDVAHLFPTSDLYIYKDERLSARAWKQGSITRDDMIQIYGDQPENIKKGLSELKLQHNWQSQGRRPNEIYFPVVSSVAWVKPDMSSDAPEKFVASFAEFLSKEVWAGGYPTEAENRITDDLCTTLLNNGITCFVDLTNPVDAHRKFSYRNHLLGISRELKKQAEVQNFPLPFKKAPSRLQVQRALKYVARAQKLGRQVYIHAGHNLEGRTPLLLACLLIEGGYSPQRAMKKVDNFWMSTLHYLIHSPMSEEQRNFVLGWKR